MTRSHIALFAVVLLAVPAASSAAAKKAAKVEPTADPAKPADARPADAKAVEAKPVDAKQAAAKLAAAKPAEAKPKPKEFQTIGKLGLKFEGPKVSQSDMSGHVMCTTDNGLAFTVGPASDFSPKTFEEARLAKNDYSPTAVQKEQKLEDGWNIQFKNKGAMGDNYFVWIRRTIGGKACQCETTATTPEQAAKVEKICLSLAKQ